MSKPLKIALVVCATLALLTLIIAAVFLFRGLGSLKPRIESMVSHALGMQVQINGPIGLGFRDLSITLGDITVRNRDATIADVKQARLDVDLPALFRNDVQMREIRLDGVHLFIERDARGTLNIEKTKTTRDERPSAFDLARISITDSTLYYAHAPSNMDLEALGCNIEGKNLHLPPGKQSPILALSVSIEATCRTLRSANVEVSDIRLAANASKGVLVAGPITLTLFEGDGSANIRADFSQPIPTFQLRYSLERFRIEQLLSTFTSTAVAHGNVDFVLDISTRGTAWADIRRGLNGEASLRGSDITVKGGNLDEELSRFESSQRFSLADVGAFLFAGPIGLALTKGYEFAAIVRGGTGVSHIRAIVSQWKIDDGMAMATDAALTTNRYRIALSGKLDLVNERFNEVTIAMVDDAGCPKVRQKISGPFDKPNIERPSILTTLAGPALNFLSGAKKIVTGKQCAPFYTGSVPPPTAAANLGNSGRDATK